MTTRQQQRLGGRGGGLALGAGLSLLVSATAAAAGGAAEVAPTAQVVTVTARRLLDIDRVDFADDKIGKYDRDVALEAAVQRPVWPLSRLAMTTSIGMQREDANALSLD